MTDEQLVEKIARVLDACDPDRVNHELCLKQARAILPIILAAREEGARAMQEAAAQSVMPTMNKRGPFAHYVSSAIRALDPAKIAGGDDA